MKKNYKEVYQAAIKGYKENKQEGAASLLNKLTKKELLEMNEQLNITLTLPIAKARGFSVANSLVYT